MVGSHQRLLVEVAEKLTIDLAPLYHHIDDLPIRSAGAKTRKTYHHCFCVAGREFVDFADAVGMLARLPVVAAVVVAEVVELESAEQLAGLPRLLGLDFDTAAAKCQITMEIHCRRPQLYQQIPHRDDFTMGSA